MKLRLRMAILLCLAAAAAYTGLGAYRSLLPSRRVSPPQEIYARFAANADSAQYFLRSSGDYIAVYESQREKQPLSVTEIELDCLRCVDRAMIEAGLPVADRQELLTLLEDLGS